MRWNGIEWNRVQDRKKENDREWNEVLEDEQRSAVQCDAVWHETISFSTDKHESAEQYTYTNKLSKGNRYEKSGYTHVIHRYINIMILYDHIIYDSLSHGVPIFGRSVWFGSLVFLRHFSLRGCEMETKKVQMSKVKLKKRCVEESKEMLGVSRQSRLGEMLSRVKSVSQSLGQMELNKDEGGD